jgi:hypothetical protein
MSPMSGLNVQCPIYPSLGRHEVIRQVMSGKYLDLGQVVLYQPISAHLRI